MQFSLKIQNRSSFEITLKGYELDVLINNIFVAKIKSAQEQIIKNNAISEIVILVNFNPVETFSLKDIAALVLQFTTNKSSVLVSIIGYFKASINFITVSRPIKLSMSLADMISTDTNIEQKKIKCDIK